MGEEWMKGNIVMQLHRQNIQLSLFYVNKKEHVDENKKEHVDANKIEHVDV